MPELRRPPPPIAPLAFRAACLLLLVIVGLLALTGPWLVWSPHGGNERGPADAGGQAEANGAPPFLGLGRWIPASELRWQSASTGWQAIGEAGLPRIDETFARGPITIAGLEYAHGIGTYPFSEVEYEIDGYDLLRATLGVDDRSSAAARVTFAILLDGTSAYESPPRARGDPPITVTLNVRGVREARLVTARDPTSQQAAFANWADFGVFDAFVAMGGRRLAYGGDTRVDDAVAADLASLSSTAVEYERYIDDHARGPSSVVSIVDARRGRYVLANSQLALFFDTAGPNPNSLTVLDRRSQRVMMQSVSVAIELGGGRQVLQARDAVVEDHNVAIADRDAPGFGPTRTLTVRLRTRAEGQAVIVRLSLLPEASAFLLQADAPGASRSRGISYRLLVDGSAPGVVVGSDPHLLVDFTRLREIRLRADGFPRELVTGQGKPIILWGEGINGALLMAPVDESTHMPWLEVLRPPGSARASLTLMVGNAPSETRSPRLYIELTPTRDLRQAGLNYQRFLDRVYPAPPLPDWFRFQWSSWYPFEMDVSDAKLSRQMDLLVRRFGDLGPWHVVLDAGWYIADGLPGSDLRAVDEAKFPRGIRAFVDEIHARGIRVLMYTTAPYLDARALPGNWAGLRGTIERHPEWLIPLRRGLEGPYAFNLQHPGVRAYFYRLFDDLYRRYGADGLLLDGLGSVEETTVGRRFIDRRGLVGSVVDQTMEIYRLAWDGARRMEGGRYVEGGVHNPAFARPYAHTFRQADELPFFSSPYPAGGLVQHIDYATYQKTVLGQRPNMGALTDETPDSTINLWWLEAGIALDSHVTFSFDLSNLTPDAIAEYRGLLNHYRPFTGVTVVDRVLDPSVFVTRRGPLAYVGLLNRAVEEATVRAKLADFGLSDGVSYTAFDVTRKEARSATGDLAVRLPARSFALYVLSSQPAVMWTTSRYRVDRQTERIAVELDGPEDVSGVAQLAVPKPRRVLLDGRVVQPGDARNPHVDEEYGYDPTGSLLTVRYRHAGTRQLVVEL